jgi:hypothetical protein
MKVFALCKTYLHVAQTLALCEWFIEKGNNPELTIFRGKTIWNNFAIKKEALYFSITDYPVVMSDMPHSSFAATPWAIAQFIVTSLKKNNLQNIMVNPGTPHLHFLSGLTASKKHIDAFFSLEEGISTYGNISTKVRAKILKRDRYSFHFFLSLGVETIKQLLFRIVTYRSGGIIECISDRNETHDGNRVMLKPLLKSTMSSNVFGFSKTLIPNNTILFLSGPFVELGIIDKQTYLSIINAVRDHFQSISLRNNFIIKPHPVEKTDKYNGYMICDFDGPVEAIFGAYRANITCVVGINSTALIYASKLFDLPSYRIEHKLIFPPGRKNSDSNLERLLAKHTRTLQL